MRLFIALMFGILLVGGALVALIPGVMAAASFQVTSFSCTPSESVLGDVFSCTAQVQNIGDAAGSVAIATLYPDEEDWLEESNYVQASGTGVDPSQSVEITFFGLRAVKTGSSGFSKIMLDDVTDTYVADNGIEVNVVDVLVAVENSVSSAAMDVSFDSQADVTAGGNIDVTLTFTVNSGGCSIGTQESQKTISGMQEGNQQSRTWVVTQGSDGDCDFTISAAATGSGGVASKIDSDDSSVSCTDCPTSSGDSNGGGGGGGAGGSTAKTYEAGELGVAQAVELASGEKVKFSFRGENYTLTLKNFTETSAEISVAGKVFTLGVEESKLLDLDGDGVDDVSVKLSSVNIVTNKVTLILKSLTEVEGGEDGGMGAFDKGVEKIKEFFDLEKGGAWKIVVIVVLVVVLVGAGYLLYRFRSRLKSRRGF